MRYPDSSEYTTATDSADHGAGVPRSRRSRRTSIASRGACTGSAPYRPYPHELPPRPRSDRTRAAGSASAPSTRLGFENVTRTTRPYRGGRELLLTQRVVNNKPRPTPPAIRPDLPVEGFFTFNDCGTLRDYRIGCIIAMRAGYLHTSRFPVHSSTISRTTIYFSPAPDRVCDSGGRRPRPRRSRGTNVAAWVTCAGSAPYRPDTYEHPVRPRSDRTRAAGSASAPPTR